MLVRLISPDGTLCYNEDGEVIGSLCGGYFFMSQNPFFATTQAIGCLLEKRSEPRFCNTEVVCIVPLYNSTFNPINNGGT